VRLRLASDVLLLLLRLRGSFMIDYAPGISVGAIAQLLDEIAAELQGSPCATALVGLRVWEVQEDLCFVVDPTLVAAQMDAHEACKHEKPDLLCLEKGHQPTLATPEQKDIFYPVLFGILARALSPPDSSIHVRKGLATMRRSVQLCDVMRQSESVAPLPTVAAWLLGYPLLYWFRGGAQAGQIAARILSTTPLVLVHRRTRWNADAKKCVAEVLTGGGMASRAIQRVTAFLEEDLVISSFTAPPWYRRTEPDCVQWGVPWAMDPGGGIVSSPTWVTQYVDASENVAL